MGFTLATYAYPDHDGATRAALAARLAGRRPLPGAFVLATCLRIEVAVPGSRSDLHCILDALFTDAPEKETARIRTGEAASVHLFRVAAGLESPILGEREVLTQFRQTVVETEQSGVVDGLFARLLELAVGTGRQARELLPASPHDSMAAVAAQVVGPSARVAVLGSGLMATAVVAGLRGLPAPPPVTIVARHPEKVAADFAEVWPFDRALEALSEFPAVVSATSAKRRLLPDDVLSRALEARTDPLTLVDMAMPPDFRPPDGAPVTYLDIDDLARMADRTPRHHDADAMVHAAAVDAYRGLVDHHQIAPVIGGLMRFADGVVARTVDRFAGRLGSAGDRAVLEQTAYTVARTLLAAPVSYLKQPGRAPEAVDTVAEAFGLDDA